MHENDIVNVIRERRERRDAHAKGPRVPATHACRGQLSVHGARTCVQYAACMCPVLASFFASFSILRSLYVRDVLRVATSFFEPIHA